MTSSWSIHIRKQKRLLYMFLVGLKKFTVDTLRRRQFVEQSTTDPDKPLSTYQALLCFALAEKMGGLARLPSKHANGRGRVTTLTGTKRVTATSPRRQFLRYSRRVARLQNR